MAREKLPAADDVAGGRLDEPFFRRSIVWLSGSRLVGTVLAQLLLVPAAAWIAFVAGSDVASAGRASGPGQGVCR